MKTKTDFNTVRWALYVALLWIAAACTQAPEIQQTQDTRKMEDSMNLAHSTDPDTLDLPAIDREAPGDIATASFGLG